jgi:Dihydrodipicolinate synthetase family
MNRRANLAAVGAGGLAVSTDVRQHAKHVRKRAPEARLATHAHQWTWTSRRLASLVTPATGTPHRTASIMHRRHVGPQPAIIAWPYTLQADEHCGCIPALRLATIFSIGHLADEPSAAAHVLRRAIVVIRTGVRRKRQLARSRYDNVTQVGRHPGLGTIMSRPSRRSPPTRTAVARQLSRHHRVLPARRGAGGVLLPGRGRRRAALVLYNIPVFTKVRIAPSAAVALASHPRIAGLKDSGRDLGYAAELLDAVAGMGAAADFSVLRGTDSMLVSYMLAGARGTICGSANVVPELVLAVYDAVPGGQVGRRAQPRGAAPGGEQGVRCRGTVRCVEGSGRQHRYR